MFGTVTAGVAMAVAVGTCTLESAVHMLVAAITGATALVAAGIGLDKFRGLCCLGR